MLLIISATVVLLTAILIFVTQPTAGTLVWGVIGVFLAAAGSVGVSFGAASIRHLIDRRIEQRRAKEARRRVEREQHELERPQRELSEWPTWKLWALFETKMLELVNLAYLPPLSQEFAQRHMTLLARGKKFAPGDQREMLEQVLRWLREQQEPERREQPERERLERLMRLERELLDLLELLEQRERGRPDREPPEQN